MALLEKDSFQITHLKLCIRVKVFIYWSNYSINDVYYTNPNQFHHAGHSPVQHSLRARSVVECTPAFETPSIKVTLLIFSLRDSLVFRLFFVSRAFPHAQVPALDFYPLAFLCSKFVFVSRRRFHASQVPASFHHSSKKPAFFQQLHLLSGQLVQKPICANHDNWMS